MLRGVFSDVFVLMLLLIFIMLSDRALHWQSFIVLLAVHAIRRVQGVTCSMVLCTCLSCRGQLRQALFVCGAVRMRLDLNTLLVCSPTVCWHA